MDEDILAAGFRFYEAKAPFLEPVHHGALTPGVVRVWPRFVQVLPSPAAAGEPSGWQGGRPGLVPGHPDFCIESCFIPGRPFWAPGLMYGAVYGWWRAGGPERLSR
eukprot:13267078-Heterocapsa_arctica.AAC.1